VLESCRFLTVHSQKLGKVISGIGRITLIWLLIKTLWIPASPFSFILCADFGKSMLFWHVVTCFGLTQKTAVQFLNYNVLFPFMEWCLHSLLRNAKDEELHLAVVIHYLGECVQPWNYFRKHHYSITVRYWFASQHDESTDIADWALLCLYQMCMIRLFKVLFVALLNIPSTLLDDSIGRMHGCLL
jgi:hypothetical protein